MNRTEQRLTLLIWVCSICISLLAISGLCDVIDLGLTALRQAVVMP